MPKVSVIIPTYNCAKYISQTIESILNQTYKDFEIIVVDSSNDNTIEAIKSFTESLSYSIAKHQNLIKYYHQKPCGVSSARNVGIRNSTGKYIAFIDGDDIWLNNKLMDQVSIMENNKNVAMIFTDGQSFDKTGIIKNSLVRPQAYLNKNGLMHKALDYKFNDGNVLKGNILRDLLFENCVPTSSVLINKECLRNIGYFNENLALAEDYDLWIRVAQKYDILYLNKVTTKYRVRNDGLSGNNDNRKYRWQKWFAKMYEIHYKNCRNEYRNIFKNKIIGDYNAAIWGYLNANDLKEVRKLCIRTLFYTKTHIKIYLYILISFLPKKYVSYIRGLKAKLCQK